MASGKGRVRFSGRFNAGTKVRLEPRVGDSYTASGSKAEATGKVGKDSVVEFDGLEPFSRWWVVGEIDGVTHAVAVTAKPAELGDPGLAATRHATAERRKAEAQVAAEQAAKAREADPLAGSPALGRPDPSRQIVDGARSSRSAKPGSGPVKLPGNAGGEPVTFSGPQAGVQAEDPTGSPQPRQEDVPEGTPQRSDTLTGEATPKDPDEIVPRVPQSEVDDGVAQRSDTELGEAAIRPDGEAQPALKQEDVPDGTAQRSDTEHGEAEPIPEGDPVEVRRRRDSSAERAKGHTPQKPAEKVTEPAKKRSSGKKRSPAKKAAKKSSARKGR